MSVVAPSSSGGARAVTLGLIAASAPAVALRLAELHIGVRGLIWLQWPSVPAHVGREFVSQELSYSAS